VGVLATATLLGSALLTLAVGFTGARLATRRLLLAACLLMSLTGLGFAVLDDFWPLLAVAFVATLNPSAGDVSVFLPLEQALLAHSIAAPECTALFARYSLVGALLGAGGTLLAALPELAARGGAPPLAAFKAMFVLYAIAGLAAGLIYRRLPSADAAASSAPASALGPSRRTVHRLAALFSLDASAGRLVVQSLLALWLLEAFGLSLATTAQLFFWSGLLTALSYFAAVPLARRLGLVNTMVFTHLPANLCLVAVPFMTDLWQAVALLLARGLLSQMDVPTRTSYVMAVVTPGRAAGGGEPDRGAARPRRGRESKPCRLDANRRKLRLAAGARGCLEDRLRPPAPRAVPGCAPARRAAPVSQLTPPPPRGHHQRQRRQGRSWWPGMDCCSGWPEGR
jgi:hypothetical protein